MTVEITKKELIDFAIGNDPDKVADTVIKIVAAWLEYGRTEAGEALTSPKMAANALLRDGIDWFIRIVPVKDL